MCTSTSATSPRTRTCRGSFCNPLGSGRPRLLARDSWRRRKEDELFVFQFVRSAPLFCRPALIRLGPGIDVFRIADCSELAFESLRATVVTVFLDEITRLVRIICEIEQLRRHSDVIDQFEIAVAHHELPCLRAVPMVFGKADSGPVWSTDRVRQRSAGEVCIRFHQSSAGAYDDGRKQIDVENQLADSGASRNVWSADDQRNSRGPF